MSTTQSIHEIPTAGRRAQQRGPHRNCQFDDRILVTGDNRPVPQRTRLPGRIPGGRIGPAGQMGRGIPTIRCRTGKMVGTKCHRTISATRKTVHPPARTTYPNREIDVRSIPVRTESWELQIEIPAALATPVIRSGPLDRRAQRPRNDSPIHRIIVKLQGPKCYFTDAI